MSGKGYFMVWVIAEFKASNYSFCWVPLALIEVFQAVSFFWIYLTWYLLFISGARYIPNMNIYSFAWRYRSGKFSRALLVDSILFLVSGLCIYTYLVSICNQLNTTRFYLVPGNLMLFLLSLPIIILQVAFSSGWLLYNHLIVSCHRRLRNWILLNLLFSPWMNLQNGCQIIGF